MNFLFKIHLRTASFPKFIIVRALVFRGSECELICKLAALKYNLAC